MADVTICVANSNSGTPMTLTSVVFLSMPPIGVALGNVDFSNLFITLSGQHYDSLAQAKQAGAATINYGLFITTVIQFLIVAFAVFILVQQVNRLFRQAQAKKEAPPQPTQEVKLLSEIRDLLAVRRT